MRNDARIQSETLRQMHLLNLANASQIYVLLFPLFTHKHSNTSTHTSVKSSTLTHLPSSSFKSLLPQRPNPALILLLAQPTLEHSSQGYSTPRLCLPPVPRLWSWGILMIASGRSEQVFSRAVSTPPCCHAHMRWLGLFIRQTDSCEGLGLEGFIGDGSGSGWQDVYGSAVSALVHWIWR